MKIIYLIRHGRPDFPDGKPMCLGITDLPLSQTGFRQAERAAAALKEKEFRVYSSPLLRAKQTAEALGRPVVILEDLQELYAGKWDGLDFDTIRVLYPELYARRMKDRSIPLPECESDGDGLRRFSCALQKAIRNSAGDIAIVGHGGIMALFLQSVTGIWQKPGYGEIITLTYEKGKFQIVKEDEDA